MGRNACSVGFGLLKTWSGIIGKKTLTTALGLLVFSVASITLGLLARSGKFGQIPQTICGLKGPDVILGISIGVPAILALAVVAYKKCKTQNRVDGSQIRKAALSYKPDRARPDFIL